MRCEVCWGGPGASRGLVVRPAPRTRALLLGLLLAAAGWLAPPARAEGGVDVLVEAGTGSELEASMHSSFLHNFQEATEGIGAMDVTGELQQNAAAAPAAFPDTSAAVGRIFRMKVPNKMEDVYLGEIVKVSLNFLRVECWTKRTNNHRSIVAS